jgi:hypothetical protein
MKSTITNQLGLGALLIALCIGLSGCLMPTSGGLSEGQFASEGTIAAVNTADWTIEIKTGEAASLVVSVVETTKLYRGGEGWKSGMQEAITFNQIETGKYLVIKYSKSPEGKLIAIEGWMTNDKSSARPVPSKTQWIPMM